MTGANPSKKLTYIASEQIAAAGGTYAWSRPTAWTGSSIFMGRYWVLQQLLVSTWYDLAVSVGQFVPTGSTIALTGLNLWSTSAYNIDRTGALGGGTVRFSDRVLLPDLNYHLGVGPQNNWTLSGTIAPNVAAAGINSIVISYHYLLDSYDMETAKELFGV